MRFLCSTLLNIVSIQKETMFVFIDRFHSNVGANRGCVLYVEYMVYSTLACFLHLCDVWNLHVSTSCIYIYNTVWCEFLGVSGTIPQHTPTM